MKIIVGLGNPEKKYFKTYHNLGFLAAGDLVEKLGMKFNKIKCDAQIAEKSKDGEKIVVARPLTYMNNSGKSALQLLKAYKAEPEDMMVIYDDYDIEKGQFRIRASGSAGTHNGMRSIVNMTGSSNFPRIRIGIKDEGNIPIIDYVLKEIPEEEYAMYTEVLSKAAEAAMDFALGKSIENVMNKFNQRIQK